MASPSPANPLGYLVKRQYNDRLYINKKLLRERLYSARNLYRKDLRAHYGCVNAIEFSNKGELLASGENVRRTVHVIVAYIFSKRLQGFCSLSFC
jgi:WD repeat-containing protein 22